MNFVFCKHWCHWIFWDFSSIRGTFGLKTKSKKKRENGHVHDSRQLTSAVDFAKQKVPQREVWSLTSCTKNSEGILMISFVLSCWFNSKQVDRTLTSSQFQMSISRSGKKQCEEWQTILEVPQCPPCLSDYHSIWFFIWGKSMDSQDFCPPTPVVKNVISGHLKPPWTSEALDCQAQRDP